MQLQEHALPAMSIGTQRHLQSLHFGNRRSGRKVYIQASLHADEIPGMLVAHCLQSKLMQLEEEGKIHGEIVLVPVANPIGLAQSFSGQPYGRFDLPTGINFNRGFLHLTPLLIPRLEGQLGNNAMFNLRTVRQHALEILRAQQPISETEVLKNVLQTLSVDADIVLDLHCDDESVLHLYTGTPLAEAVHPLACLMGAHAVLLARVSGDDPFDESCSRTWWELAEHFGSTCTLPLGCVAVTVELRGKRDVCEKLAMQDAQAILDYLCHQGHISDAKPELPPALCQASPLAGVEPVRAPHAGVLLFHSQPGEEVQQGQAICEVLDATSGQRSTLCAGVTGKLYAHTSLRYAYRGMEVCRIAGAQAFRSGNLLSL